MGAGSWDVYLLGIDSEGSRLWERVYGGNQSERSYSVIQSGDGGSIVAAYTASFGTGPSDAYILKIDDQGELVWEETCGGSQNERATSVVRSGAGEYIAVGFTDSYGAGKDDVYLFRIADES